MSSKWKWLPPWRMPSDPVKAVYWFLHWFLQVLVRYFVILILAGVVFEAKLNGIVGLVGTLLVGLVVWGLLAGLLAVANFLVRVSSTLAEVNRLSRNPFGSLGNFDAFQRSATTVTEEENVVEGSIITDLDEERRKRRHES